MYALVTGGCSGLGKSFTKELLKKGYKVYALYNTSEESAKKLEQEYSNLKCIKCDITNEESVAKTLYDLEDLDLVINNAGIAKDNEYFDKTLEEFMEVLKTNLGGCFVVSKFAAKRLKNSGTIINISSNNALNNYNPLSMDYDASKVGINMLTKDFAIALKNLKIKVVSVCPGWINTESIQEMNPLFLKEEMKKSNQKELLDPDLLASKILNISSELNSGDIIEIKEL